MTVKDEIPSFPELIGFYQVKCEVAHGTSDERLWKYHSVPESEYAEELATAKIMDLIRRGQIRATGRMSETKKGSAARWQVQQYKQHSKVRTYIEPEFWRSAVVLKIHLGFKTARVDGKEYTDILLVFEDCVKHLADEVAAHQKDLDVTSERIVAARDYSTPYIDLMWQAIDHFGITDENQPIKDNLVEWFLAREIAGQKIRK